MPLYGHDVQGICRSQARSAYRLRFLVPSHPVDTFAKIECSYAVARRQERAMK